MGFYKRKTALVFFKELIVPDLTVSSPLPGCWALEYGYSLEPCRIHALTCILSKSPNMSLIRSESKVTSAVNHSEVFVDVEKGVVASSPLPNIDQKTETRVEGLLSPISPIYQGITPSSSVPVLSLSAGGQVTKVIPPPATKKRPSRWILFQLWFNTYRKFFIFVTLLNLTGIIMAALGRFHYAENHLGALVLGNLLCAILMRNELFLRFLYLISIYGLRSVSPLIHNICFVN